MVTDVRQAAERSDADPILSIPFRTSPTDAEPPARAPGFASSSECPRKGSVLLESWDQRRLFINTNCKTWGCLSCRDRSMAGFKMKVSAGVSTLGRCAFITVTYQREGLLAKGVQCVPRDWAALSRRLKKNQPAIARLQWLRVMELTKNGIPHHHLVMGPIPSEIPIRCWRRGQKIVAEWYLARAERCQCLSHRISREWLKVTEDSWMVHTVPVTSGKGAGGYLAKYMRKEFNVERAGLLGMARRWSTSRGWPGPKRVRLVQSARPEGWRRRTFAYGHVQMDIEGGPADLAARTGDEADRKMDSQRGGRRLAKKIEGAIVNA